MKKHLPLHMCAMCVLAMAVLLASAAQAQTATITLTSNQQTIDGFGFSTAWTPAMTSAQGNVLFGTGSGQLGFSLLRIRIDPNESWGNESSNPTPTEIETWMANNAPTVGKPIVMPEAVNFNDSYSDPTLNNSTAAS